jgi:hypothetical protein
LTVDVSTLTNDDAPQIRITQQHETKHFLRLFPNNMIVIHSGKYLERRQQLQPKTSKPAILYDIRASSECLDDQFTGEFKVRAIECLPNDTIDGGMDLSTRLNADHVCLVTNTDYAKFYLHIGDNALPIEKQAAFKLAEIMNEQNTNCFVSRKGKPVPDVVEVKQGAESDEFCKLLAIKDKKKLLYTKAGRIHPRMFAFSGATGVVEVDRFFNFCQDDLDLGYCLLLDCVDRLYMWMSTQAINPSDQKIMLEASIDYFRKSIDEPIPIEDSNNIGTTPKFLLSRKLPGVNYEKVSIDSNLVIVNPCQEPLEFTRHFHGWGPHRSRYLTDLYSAIVQNLGGSTDAPQESATPTTVKKQQQDQQSVKKVNVSREVFSAVDRYNDYTRKTYPYEELLRTPPPLGVDSSKLEQYLSLEEFETVFGMSKAQFDKSPVWKQEKMKKQVYLF